MTTPDEADRVGTSGTDGTGSTDERPPSQSGGLADAVVLLCGTAQHESDALGNVPAVAATLADLSHVLAERCGAHEVTIELDPPTPSELGDALSLACSRADDVLLIYYVGHGLLSSDGELYLAAGGADPRSLRLPHTALRYQTLRSYVHLSRARAKIVILDCCFSGKAIGALGARQQMLELAAIDGAFVLTSAGREEVALAPPGARHTAFSGALISLLTGGDPHASPQLTLEEVYRSLHRTLPAAGYPKPCRWTTGRTGELVLASNPASPGDPPPKPPPPPPPPPPKAVAALCAAAAGAAAVPFLASAVHGDGWVLPFGVRGLVLSSVWGLVLLAATGLLAAIGADRLADTVTRLLARRRRLRLRLAVAAVLALLLSTGLGVGAVEASGAGRVWLGDCPPAEQLRVLTTPEGYEPARQLARSFELHTARGNYDCPDIRILVYAESTERTTLAFRRGWNDDDRIEIGPRPDVWLPDSRAEVRAAGDALPVAEDRTVAVTPLVVAVPTGQLASAGGQGPHVTGDSWPELLDTFRRMKWNLIAPSPGAAAGDLTRVALYAGAKGDPDTTTARTVERYVEASHDRAGYVPGASQTELLCALRGTASAARTALVVTEQALARFNQGAALGPTCGPTSQASDAQQLTALYPVATPVLDRPFVRLERDSLTDVQHAAAQRFGNWLGMPEGKQALNDVGLRPVRDAHASAPDPDVRVRAPLSDEFGVGRAARFGAPVADDVLNRTRSTYASVHRPGRILLLLDASGSMAASGPDGRALSTVAAQGVTDSLGLMGPRDEFGAWSFQGDGTGGIRQLVPIGSRDEAVRDRPRPEATRVALRAVRPYGPAPLHAAIVAGAERVGPTGVDRVTAVVVLTDGEDDNASDITLGQLESAVKDKNARVFALAVGTTSCRATTLARITGISGGFCLEAESTTMRQQISAIFEALWDA